MIVCSPRSLSLATELRFHVVNVAKFHLTNFAHSFEQFSVPEITTSVGQACLRSRAFSNMSVRILECDFR